MQITAIKPAVKNPSRTNIFVDGKFSFSLDLAQLADAKLKVGQLLTEQQLSELKQQSSFGKLYQRTLEWVLSRPRSVKEVRDYLTRKKYQKPEYAITDHFIAAIIEKLQTKNYLNDVNFTTFYVENRFAKKGISAKRLRQELLKKGVAESIINQALSDSSRDDASEIQKIIAKKRRLKTYQDDAKLIQYLVNHGFDYSLAQKSVRETDSQNLA